MSRSAVQGVRNMERGYEAALRLLNSRRRKGRPRSREPNKFPNLSLMPNSSGEPGFRGTPGIVTIRDWLQQLGHLDASLNRMNVIHVAGTKGKGSTCAFVSSFLQAYGRRTGFPRKVGLYTSPHLKHVRERMQINSVPLSEDAFAKYIFEVWDKLSEYIDPAPRYLQLLYLTSVHAFISEGIDVAIYETHHGGEFDPTNVISKPVAAGITAIGMDHVPQLGPALENIAWHKAGIFKTGSPAFSAIQDPVAAAMLQQRAAEKEVSLKLLDIDPLLPVNVHSLRLDIQRRNASLALALANAFVQVKSSGPSPCLSSDDVLEGAENFSWPGRFQRIAQGDCQWFLDGAHNELSVEKAAQWFVNETCSTAQTQSDGASPTRILIYGQISARDGAAMLRSIARSMKQDGVTIQHLILATYEERRDGSMDLGRCYEPPETPFSPELQSAYAEAWKSVDSEAAIAFEPTIEGALDLARKLGDQSHGMQTLVTGSLYLVGGALRLLEPEAGR